MSDTTFRMAIEKLTKTTNIEIYMIHLERATERLSYISTLENSLRTKLNIFPGADGYQLVKDGHPTICQQRGPPATRGAGDIGCTVSHIRICKEALAKGYEYIVIFEDDCEFVSNLDAFNTYIDQFINLNTQWDLFLLGSNPLSSSRMPDSNISKVNRFDCTHALIMNRTFMTNLINTYEEYYNNNTVLSIDTMYSNVIEKYNMNAYGFTNNRGFFNQKHGAYSYIIEGVRW
jgi:GR25 family glycosyltransferase involved in LPS biosynthesis